MILVMVLIRSRVNGQTILVDTHTKAEELLMSPRSFIGNRSLLRSEALLL